MDESAHAVGVPSSKRARGSSHSNGKDCIMQRLRVLAALALVVGVALATVSIASAHVLSLTVTDRADRQDDGNLVIVSGTASCTFGEMADLFASVQQSQGRFVVAGGGSTTFMCTGAPQVWSVAIVPLSPFKSGPALASVGLSTSGPDGFDSRRLQERVQLH